MLVRLTDKGRKQFGFAGDRTETNVSHARAFAMMTAGLAVEDKGFMALFSGPVEAPAPAPEPEAPQAPAPVDPAKTTTKETSVSRAAGRREKAKKG
jgi:hypothetical protein